MVLPRGPGHFEERPEETWAQVAWQKIGLRRMNHALHRDRCMLPPFYSIRFLLKFRQLTELAHYRGAQWTSSDFMAMVEYSRISNFKTLKSNTDVHS